MQGKCVPVVASQRAGGGVMKEYLTDLREGIGKSTTGEIRISGAKERVEINVSAFFGVEHKDVWKGEGSINTIGILNPIASVIPLYD